MSTAPPPALSTPPSAALLARRGAWVGAAAVVGLVGALYGRTLAPGLGGTIDSAEFQHAAYQLGIVHPTGYPLYLLMARLWITLVPLGDVAYRVNLLSAVCGVGVALGVYATVLWLTRQPLAGLLAATLAATHPLVWEQAVVAEVNSLNLLLVVLTLYVLLRWRAGAAWLPLAALLYGLALANHRTALLVAPGIALFLVLAWRGGRRVGWQTALGSLVAVLAPLFLYLYIPLRAATTPWYTNTWDNFWREVGGASALPTISDTLGRPLGPRLLLVFDLVFPHLREALALQPNALGAGLGALGLLGLAALGAGLALRRGRGAVSPSVPVPQRIDAATFWLYAVPFLLIAGVMVIYDVDVIGDYLALNVVFAAIWAGVGALALQRWLAARLPTLRWERVASGRLLLGLAALPLLAVATNFSALDWSGRNEARHFWQEVQAAPPLPANAFIIGGWNRYNELRYLQVVEGWRPDVQGHVLDDLVAGGHLDYIDEWLAQGRAVYLTEPVPDITDHFASQPEAALVRLTRRAEVTQPTMEHAVGVQFGPDIVLDGYTLRPARPRPGDMLRITLFWHALHPPQERLVVFTHLLDRDRIDHKVGQKDDEPGRGYRPTTGWTPGSPVVDTLDLPIQADAPPATYRLMVGLYTRSGEKRLAAQAADGRPLGNYWEMTTVAVGP